MAYVIVSALIRFLIPFVMRLHVTGAERVPATGPVIIVSNHLGLVDPFPIGARVRRRITILAKVEMFDWPIIGGLARMCGVVPVHRGASDRDALRLLGDALAAGGCILVLPEGTYPKVPLPAAMLPLKTGAAFLAVRSGAAVQPVGITGTERIWYRARGWRLWHRPRVDVTFGEPYVPQLPAGLSSKAAYQAVANDMGRRIAALLPEAYRGYYATESSAEPAPLSGGLPHIQRLGQDAHLE